jgi:hypothetical protein
MTIVYSFLYIFLVGQVCFISKDLVGVLSLIIKFVHTTIWLKYC